MQHKRQHQQKHKSNQGNKKHHRRPGASGRASGQRNTRLPSFRAHTTASKSGKLVEGRMRIGGNGTGYVAQIGVKGDIEIPNEFLNTALHGDQVEINLFSRIAGGHQLAEVERILLRAKTQFVGVIEQDGNTYVLIPDDHRMYRNILLSKDALHGGKPGEKVLVQMDSWTDKHSLPSGSVLKVIGKPGLHETEIQAIALERGFDGTFPKEVSDEALGIPEPSKRDMTERRDFRQTLTFTIDPKDAKDFDDALSFKKLENGNYEIGVHIADVTHYVRPGMKVEKEAASRATSVYLVDRTIPMLPERLSNDLCSLKPNVDRLTFSAVFEVAPNGYVKQEWFGKTVIHSVRRFTYEEAQELIEKPVGEFGAILTTLNTMAKTLREERIRAGGVEFESNEVRCELDKDGKVVRIYRKEMKDANKLIEEFMLLANRKVTEWIDKKIPEVSRVFVYRIHGEPNAEKISDLRAFLKGIGHEIKVRGNTIHGQDINAMLAKVDKLGEKSFVHIATIRAMAKAIYSTKNIGHFGLGFAHYTHFTSPIRRYPDMMVHRLLHQYLSGKPVATKELENQERLCRYASEMEISAAEAERASIRLKQVEYWSDKIGAIWEGSISGVAAWGVFVEDKATGTEGMIHVNDLDGDYYVYEEAQYRMVGKNTKKVFRLGDPISAKVRDVDLKKRLIALSLIQKE